MAFSVNGRDFGKATAQGVHLQQIIGAYQLTFIAEISLRNTKEDYEATAEIHGARVSLKGIGGVAHLLGMARPETPFRIRLFEFSHSEQVVLSMSVSGQQIAAIEAMRNGGDLDFELIVTGNGSAEHGPCSVHDQWIFHISRSEWIEKLNKSGAINIELFEVPIPIGPKTPQARQIFEHVDKARRHLAEAGFSDCVAECRLAVQELGVEWTQEATWSDGVLKKMAVGDRGTSKKERELAVFASVRSYAHLPHHSASEGGTSDYTRADAIFVLSLTIALTARVFRG
ncbi:MAG: hypothetical protein AB7I36_07240 [Rhodospirillaceae bacterium]